MNTAVETSIITPVYNCKDYIDETIQSVLAQTYSDWELILIDDCSTDGTFELITRKYSNTFRVKILQNVANSGSGYSRNSGLSLASGRFVAFLDSDDLWAPTKLEKQIAFMKKRNAAISHTSYSFIDKFGKPRSGYVCASALVNLARLMKKTEIGTSTAMIDRKIVGSVEFDLMRTRQDIRLWMELMSSGFSSHGLDEVLVKYRVRENQISSNKFEMLVKTFFVYAKFDKIPLSQRISYFLSYVLNSIYKRVKRKT